MDSLLQRRVIYEPLTFSRKKTRRSTVAAVVYLMIAFIVGSCVFVNFKSVVGD